MTTWLQLGPCRVACGDCLDLLPVDADVVVADPPFGINFDYGAAHDDDPLAYEAFMKNVVQKCSNVPVCFFWQGMPNAPRWHRWFPSDFRIFAACKGFVQFRPTPIQWSFDPIIFWGKPSKEPRVTSKDWHVQNEAPFGAHRERIDHPCPRPLEQVRYVVELATEIQQTVLDPFMGSGTTAIACIRTGRQFIGIEKDPAHFATAVARIRRELSQPMLLPPVAAIHTQTALLP